MDKYEYRLKAEQIEKLVKKKDYQTAVKISDTTDWRRVKNLNMLYIVADLSRPLNGMRTVWRFLILLMTAHRWEECFFIR